MSDFPSEEVVGGWGLVKQLNSGSIGTKNIINIYVETTLAKSLSIKCVYPFHLPTCSHTSLSLLTGATQGADYKAAQLDKIMQVIFSPYCKTLEQSRAGFN